MLVTTESAIPSKAAVGTVNGEASTVEAAAKTPGSRVEERMLCWVVLGLW